MSDDNAPIKLTRMDICFDAMSDASTGADQFTYENRIFLIIFILFTYEITY
jgi:hypothetical protein